MTIEGNGTELDLDAILAARWADPQVFPAAEFARAEAFWRARRALTVYCSVKGAVPAAP